ncbi:hypothetical protein ACFW2V_13390 [Streptomyces sp. NPDC058947]|uniref:hypothetical protein n=1 Tax=Streptomyces sp. NPDC058947 TaxID=3346675 RepID=UPI003676AE27
MPTYGYRLTIDRGDGMRWPIRREIEAPDGKTARQWLDGWLAVEGYDENDVDILLIADGMTFREHMVHELASLGGRMRKRFSVVMDGPVSREEGEVTAAQARLWLPNGRGVSLTSKLGRDNAYIDTEMFPIRKEPGDRYGWVLDGAGVVEYSVPIDTGQRNDLEVVKVLGALAPL